MTEKRRVEQAVNQAQQRISKLAEVIEHHGGDLVPADLTKMFHYLRAVLTSAEQKAQVAHAHALAAKGFSLDMELPTPPVRPTASATPPKPTPHPILDAPDNEDEIDFVDDDEIEAIEATIATKDAIANPDTVKPAGKRRLVGRAVGTKEPIFTFDEPEKTKPTKPERGEVPDKTGYIADAGFLDDND